MPSVMYHSVNGSIHSLTSGAAVRQCRMACCSRRTPVAKKVRCDLEHAMMGHMTSQMPSVAETTGSHRIVISSWLACVTG
jgi:hypothetical protein